MTSLKKLEDQVLVITGASSGIGLSTALMAASKGARLVLCSRNQKELDRIAAEINSHGLHGGQQAIAVECDVADPDAVDMVGRRALEAFGGFDTWINNAGLSIYGKLTEVPLAEKRQLFDINFWGVVHGCRTAVRHLRHAGGVVINIGSVLSERAIPIQGIYSASKHAVKAYTDALRIELESEKLPVHISLIKPAAIDTPFPDHAVNHMEHHPSHQAPVYAPEVVAKAILECCENPRRDVFIGGSGKFYSLMETFLPRLADLFMEKSSMESGQSDAQLDDVKQHPSLFHPPYEEGQTRGSYPSRVKTTSAYTRAAMHPGIATLFAASLGVAAAAGITWLQGRNRRMGMSTATEAQITHSTSTTVVAPTEPVMPTPGAPEYSGVMHEANYTQH